MAAAAAAEEPFSPTSRLMHVPCFDLSVIPVMGFATTIDVIHFKKCVGQTLARFPRFCSILVVKDEKSYDYWWKRTTLIVDDHIIVPDLDPYMESPDKFVEDYTSTIAKKPFNFAKPLWEVHVLNLKTSDANATVIFRIHHSVGDGVSLISLVIASGKKISDPESLPVLPSKKKVAPPAKGLVKRLFRLAWMMILVMFYTVLDIIKVSATVSFLKDVENPLKRPPGVERSATRFAHRIVDLEDVKLIKNALKVSFNDVILGATQAGLCKYLEKRYETQTENANGGKPQNANDIIRKRRIRISIAFNLRPPASVEELAEVMKGKELEKNKWGNLVGGIYVRLRTFDDPLAYIHQVKIDMDKWKLSLQPKFQYFLQAQVSKFVGVKVAAQMLCTFLSNTSVAYSNVTGPEDEILLFGHRLNYIAPTVSGFPQAVILHYQSYAKKLIICLAADEKLIPDPHELFDCLQSSLENIKDTVIKKGLIKDSK